MKKTFLLFFIIFSLLEAKKITVKFASLAPEGTVWNDMLIEMKQEWQTATENKVRIKIYPGGILGDERDMVRNMRIGRLHGAGLTTEGLTELAPDFSAFFLPMVYKNEDDIYKVLNELLPDLEKTIESRGAKLLYIANLGWAYWFTKEIIKHPDDLLDKRIFTWAGNYRYAEIYKRAGYSVVPLAGTEILSSLQTGMVDAITTMPLYALAGQSFGIANNMLDLKWGFLLAGIVIDLNTWNSIPEKYHTRLMEISNNMQKKSMEMNRKAELDAINAMKGYGLKVQALNQEEMDAWEKRAEEIIPILRGYTIPENLFDRVFEILKN